MTAKELYDYSSKFSAREWLNLLIRSVNEKQIDGINFPSFPDASIQSSFVGSSNEHALREAFVFYSIIEEELRKANSPLHQDSKVLDFGCGWGRYARFFYRNVYHDNLYLADPWQMIIDVCKETKLYGQLIKIDLLPPTIFNSNSFDLIFAYSVFSHLSEKAANAWINELARVTKPGGHIIITTQGRTFIDFCNNIRERGATNGWEETLARSFVDVTENHKQYDAGKFLYAPNGGGEALPGDIYGDALIPGKYVQQNWTKDNLKLSSFVDDRSVLPQAYMVLRKKS